MIDCHCHLEKKYYENIDKVIMENRQAGISKIIVSGCEIDAISEVILLADKYPDVYLALGFHPSEVDTVDYDAISCLEKYLQHPKVVALGEIGLDYHYGKETREKQLQLFERQLLLAEKYNLPVVIHSRDAVSDTIDMLKKFQVKGMIHCFSGSIEIARKYIKMGYLLGIGGVITFKNSNLGKVVAQIPLSSLLLETDSPYLAPVPYRGEKNSSKYLPIIAEKIASEKEISVKEVIDQTSKNAEGLFDFSSSV